MSQETLSTAAAIGTFVVIAATAIAAVAQLRHLRAANQVSAVRVLMGEYDGAELRDAFHFVLASAMSRRRHGSRCFCQLNSLIPIEASPRVRLCAVPRM